MKLAWKYTNCYCTPTNSIHHTSFLTETKNILIHISTQTHLKTIPENQVTQGLPPTASLNALTTRLVRWFSILITHMCSNYDLYNLLFETEQKWYVATTVREKKQQWHTHNWSCLPAAHWLEIVNTVEPCYKEHLGT